MLPSHSNAALKEWAVTVEALERGAQIVLLRKGGIREEGKEFRAVYPQFLLYPTYEHQRADLMKPAFAKELRELLERRTDWERVTFTHWARLEEALELTDAAALGRLSPFHIWSDDYAESRLRWKPRKPLTAMLLRVYRLAEAQQIPYIPAFGGCRSWVTLDSEVALGELTPVMTEDQFQTAAAAIRNALTPSAV